MIKRSIENFSESIGYEIGTSDDNNRVEFTQINAFGE
jgi:hypothetical protein